MATKSKYIIDSQGATAKLYVYVADILVSTYSYENDKVTLSERLTPVDVPLTTLHDNIDQIFEWRQLILKIIAPAYQVKNRFQEDIHKKANELLFTFKYKNNLVTDANFQQGNSYCTFQGRPEIQMGFYDFIGWSDSLLLFYIECFNF